MRIAICDDCKSDASEIYRILLSHPLTKTSMIDIYTSSEDFLQILKKNNKYDVAFLDIEMPGVNGLDLGKSIKATYPDTYIVFITSYSQYSIEAFDCEAFHYLLKPLNKTKADDVISKIVRKYQEHNKFHIIKIKTQTIRIPIKDIYYIECCRKHIIYYLKDISYENVGSISAVYDELKEYGFCQIHQGYIVNMDRIQQFEKNAVILDDGRKVVVSARKRTEVLKTYSKYVEVHA